MHAALSFAVTAFTSIFSIVDPFAALPVYLALTARDSPARRSGIALRASLTCLTVLCVFAAGGSLLFRFFGITIPAFRVAGGILLFTVALEMMQAKPSGTRSTKEETEEGAAREDVGVMPVGVPLLSGPGAIASAMVLSQQAKTPLQTGAVFGAIGLTAALTWLVLRFADPVARVLGRTGLNLATRIMGLILAATAVQFVIDGVQEALHLGR
jgi:multiple antibiotic resistance protein